MPMTGSILATVLVVLSALGWLVIPRATGARRLIICAVLFALTTGAVVHVSGSLLEPRFAAPGTDFRLWQQLIVSAWWLLAARLAIEIGRLVMLRGAISREGRLFSDLLAGLLYLAVALTIASIVFALPIGGLVATSGVIAIVLGLALQNTLADVFAGIAVGIERPFSIGDLVALEGAIEGEVVQINWRSVQIRTGGNDLATVPNSVIAKSRIVNRSVPSPVRTDSVTVPCEAEFEPRRVVDLLHRAILLCPEILDLPAPSVALARVGRRMHRYTVTFSVARSAVLGQAKSNLLQQILRQLRAGGGGQASSPSSSGGAAVTPPDLAGVSLFQGLAAEARDRLQAQLVRHELEPGQILFAQGDTEASLFIITTGVLEVSRRAGEVVHTIGRISAGDYIGEIGMLTGAPHAATVKALTPGTVFELRKDHVAPLLAEEPQMVHQFELSARRGQALIERGVAASVGTAAVPPGALLDRIRAFFHFDR
jgi:small-conductance mechanosensitive channel